MISYGSPSFHNEERRTFSELTIRYRVKNPLNEVQLIYAVKSGECQESSGKIWVPIASFLSQDFN